MSSHEVFQDTLDMAVARGVFDNVKELEFVRTIDTKALTPQTKQLLLSFVNKMLMRGAIRNLGECKILMKMYDELTTEQ